MLRYRIFAVAIVITLVFGITTIDCAIAGEKFKAHGSSYMVKWERLEVGDEEGHVIAITESQQFYFNETSGDKHPSTSIGTMDLNTKTGQGSGKGYGVSIDKDGDKTIRTWEGKAVGRGHWQGTFSYIKGTGKYEGIKGGGTWDQYSIAPKQSYVEVEGEMEIPQK
jgi:hypothetical protein